MKRILLVFSAFLLPLAFASYAVDTSIHGITKEQWACLHFQDYFMLSLMPVYDPTGFVDEAGIHNMLTSIQAGIGSEALFSPCLANCKNNLTNGADQVKATIDALNKDLASVETNGAFVWVDIDATQPWSSDKAKNQEFILNVLNTVNNINGIVGVKTSQAAWSKLFGANFTQASLIAKFLWWVYWNGKEDMTTGWTPFGGWDAPYVHQYAGGVKNDQCMDGFIINYSYFDENDLFSLNSRKAKNLIYKRPTHKFNGS